MLNEKKGLKSHLKGTDLVPNWGNKETNFSNPSVMVTRLEDYTWPFLDQKSSPEPIKISITGGF